MRSLEMCLEIYSVKAIQIAPFKSGDTIALEKASITLDGMETVDGVVKDHEYFAVRATPDTRGIHHFVTQRFSRDPNNPKVPSESFRKLALIKPEINSQGLVLTWDHQQAVRVPEENDPTKVLQVRLWEYEGGALEVPELTEWLRDVSGYDVRVVKTAGPWNRMTRQNYVPNNNPLRAQDGYPIHPILIEDVMDISQYAGVEVPWRRFRPQIVLEGGEPWSLHNAFEGEVEGVGIIQPKPCGRCEIPRIDQDTGELTQVKPLTYIRGMRPYWVNKDGELDTIMGENWLPQDTDIVRVGSEFRVSSHRNPPLEFRWKEITKDSV